MGGAFVLSLLTVHSYKSRHRRTCPDLPHVRIPPDAYISLHVFPSILTVFPATLMVSLSPLSVSSCIRSSCALWSAPRSDMTLFPFACW
jgi:hypothetical protein